MNLFVINRIKSNIEINTALNTACKNLYVNLQEITIENYQKITIGHNDILYRISTDNNSKSIEKILINKNPKTFFCSNSIEGMHLAMENVIDATIRHQIKNIPIPKTSFINTTQKNILQKVVRELGGFPVIIKRVGEEKGIGVDKIDSLSNLIDIAKRYIKNVIPFIIREYIDSPGVSFRSIVLGNKVLVTYKNISLNKTDFRSNIDQKRRKRELVEILPEDKKMIVKAVKFLGIEFGAVDFAYDDKKQIKIFEVNFPCNFIPAQNLSKIDIAQKMLQHLINKGK